MSPLRRGVDRRLRRFLVGGSLVTAADLGALAGLVALGLAPVPADAAAVGTATVLSWSLHRRLTFADDPHVRWVHEPGWFVVVAVLAGSLDVAVVGALTTGPALPVAAAKAVALVLSGALRLVLYRSVVWASVRREQAEPTPRSPAPGRQRLSVVVPARDEERRIAGTVGRLREELADLGDGPDGGVEILVVDSASRDRTGPVAREAGADVVVRAGRRGKGRAVRAGVRAASGRTVVFTDADLAYPPDHVRRVLEAVEAGWDVVVGSRAHPQSTATGRRRSLRNLGSRLTNLVTHALLLGRYRDTQCGLKGFRSDVAGLLFRHARIDGFAFDVELLHLVERYRLSLLELPVHVRRVPGSSVRLGVDGLAVVRDVLRVRRWSAQGLYDPAPGELEALGAADRAHGGQG